MFIQSFTFTHFYLLEKLVIFTFAVIDLCRKLSHTVIRLRKYEVNSFVLFHKNLKCSIFRMSHFGYENVLQKLNLKWSKDGSRYSDVTLFGKLLKNYIDDSSLLSRISFKINHQNIRNKHFFSFQKLFSMTIWIFWIGCRLVIPYAAPDLGEAIQRTCPGR